MEKIIRITDVQLALDVAQKRAKERIMTAKDIDAAVAKLAKHPCPKKHLKGSMAHFYSYYGTKAKSYTYMVSFTVAEFKHNGKEWVLVDIFRGMKYEFPKEEIKIQLSDDAKTWIKDYAIKKYSVM